MHVHTFLQSANCIILENVARSFAIVFERKKFLVLLVISSNKSLGFLDKHLLHSQNPLGQWLDTALYID